MGHSRVDEAVPALVPPGPDVDLAHSVLSTACKRAMVNHEVSLDERAQKLTSTLVARRLQAPTDVACRVDCGVRMAAFDDSERWLESES